MKAKTLLNLEGSGRVTTDTSTSTSIANKTVVSDLISDYDTQVQKYLNEKIDNDALADYVVDQGTSGIWTWRKWNSGIAECWGQANVTQTSSSTEGSLYYVLKYVNFPTNLFTSIPLCWVSTKGNWIGGATTGNSITKNTWQGYVWASNNVNAANALVVNIYARGHWG